MTRDSLWILVLTALAAFPCAARTRVGVHPHAEVISVSPNERWLYSGPGSETEYNVGRPVPVRRHDLRTGRWRTTPYSQFPQWLSNGQVALSIGTEDENRRSERFGGEQAPIIGLFGPTATRPTVVFRDKFFDYDSLFGFALSADGRTGTTLSQQFVRRFDARTGRLQTRYKNPIPHQSPKDREMGNGTLSPDGRFLLSTFKPRLYNAKTGAVRRVFPPNRQRALDLEWITSTVFALNRTETYKGDDRNYTEFYDAVTCKRLWVLADFQRRDPNHSFWQSYPVIAQPNAIIVCGQNSWTWRDARLGRVLREAMAPTIWKFLDQNLYQIVVSGDDYFTIDKKGEIWRDKFRFTSRRKSTIRK